jgi:molybdopterin molybdotransferase
MLSVSEARERMLSQFQALSTESIPLIAAAQRVLAEDVTAAHDLPLFDNSSMDGFAIRAEDSLPAAAGARVSLRVVADIPAGTAPKVTLARGEAARIMTGAQMPAGADAVIAVEDTDVSSRAVGTEAPQTISFQRQVQAGENVRRRGMDMRAGESALPRGRELKPQDLGLLAMLGLDHAQVYRRPRAALLSSGDELLEAGAKLEDGKVRDSNSYTLAALLENGGAQVIRLGVAKDTRESVTALFDRAVEEHADLILSSAGVSVGAFDCIREVVEQSGELNFWRVNMRPGKPLAFGKYRGINFIGLPGNPVSAFVGFEVFVRAVLGRMSGRSDGGMRRMRVRCGEEVHSDGRESYLRARLHEQDGVRIARLTGHQGSGNLLSLVQANALLIIPAGVKCVPAGQDVEAYLI